MSDRLPWWAIFLTPVERVQLRAIRARAAEHERLLREHLGWTPPLGAWPPPPRMTKGAEKEDGE